MFICESSSIDDIANKIDRIYYGPLMVSSVILKWPYWRRGEHSQAQLAIYRYVRLAQESGGSRELKCSCKPHAKNPRELASMQG